MDRIERIGGILEYFSAPALLTVIQPDGDQGQQSETLRGKIITEYGNGLPFEEDDVKAKHSNQLKQTAEGEEAAQIEKDDGQYACQTVIYKTDDAQQQGDKDGQECF